MTLALPLGHETCRRAHVESLKAEWHFRVIYEINYTLSMEMSFFTPMSFIDAPEVR